MGGQVTYAFKRAPSSTADYKVINNGDKYSFFGDTATSKAMGCIVNYGVAQAIIAQSAGWSTISEPTYESRKSTVSTDFQSRPDQLYPNVQYFLIEGGNGATFFAIAPKPYWFSETLNSSDSSVEYNILRNTDLTYVQALFQFLKDNAIDQGTDPGKYNDLRANAYQQIQTEATSGPIDIALP